MPKERNKAVPAVYLFLRKGNEVLLLKRKGSGYYDGWYSVPAGHVEADELPVQALIRETKEEIGITLKARNVRFVHAMYRMKRDVTGDRVDFFYVVEKWFGKIKNVEQHKCEELRWVSVKKLPKNIVHYVKDVIRHVEKGVLYSELDFKHHIPNPTKT